LSQEVVVGKKPDQVAQKNNAIDGKGVGRKKKRKSAEVENEMKKRRYQKQSSQLQIETGGRRKNAGEGRFWNLYQSRREGEKD